MIGGTVVTAVGAIAEVTTGDGTILDEGTKTLNYAKNKAIDVVIGKFKFSGSTNANISRPYNITFNSVHTDFKVLQGVVGMAIIDPILLVFRGLLQNEANNAIKILLSDIADAVRKTLTEIKFSDDTQINGLLQQLWQPQNLYCKFNGRDQLNVSLKLDVVQSLSVPFTHSLSTYVTVT